MAVTVELALLSRVSYGSLEITGSRLRGLLALLAGDPHVGCSASRLVDALWPDEQPEHPGKALQVLVSRARARLGPGVIVSTPGGYRLSLREDQIDASAVLLSTSESEKRSRAGDHLAALGHAEAGLAQLLVRLLQAPHADRLGRLRRHRDAPSLPVSSPAARSMALASRRSPVTAIAGRDWLMVMVALLLRCRKESGTVDGYVAVGGAAAHLDGLPAVGVHQSCFSFRHRGPVAATTSKVHAAGFIAVSRRFHGEIAAVLNALDGGYVPAVREIPDVTLRPGGRDQGYSGDLPDVRAWPAEPCLSHEHQHSEPASTRHRV